MKKKLYVVSFTGNSGLTDYSVSLCKELAHSCDLLFVTADSYDANKYAADFAYKKIFRRTRHYPIDIFKFLFFILFNKPDVILFESWIKYPIVEWFLLKIFKLNGITLALTVHDLLPHYPKPWSALVLSRFYQCFDKLIVHSKKSEDGLSKMGVHTKPLLVPHGIYDIFNTKKLTKQNAKEFFAQIQENDFVVLFFGHIETRKGILEFLSASDLISLDKNVKFLVAGGNSLNGEAQTRFETYRSHHNVMLHDYSIPMEDVQQYFTIADIVVLPYLEGTTSGVIKLAMAFNKPIIATDVGDFSETLEDWSGLLIHTDKVAENLVSAIVDIQSDYQNYLDNVNKSKEKYEWPAIAKQHDTFLFD